LPKSAEQLIRQLKKPTTWPRAWFVHANMPRGIDFEDPPLSADNAYGAAAFINEQPRPRLPGLARDFPAPG
jgi:cytochrome c